MIDLDSFHSRLCDFAANVILDCNEMVRQAANTRSTVEEVKETSSVEQGELFADFAPKSIKKPVKASPAPRREKETTSVATKLDIRQYPKPKKHYTYDEYLKIFCGNSAAAEYWWKKDMQRLEEEQKCGHTA